jgi:uncharacterized protein (TIGR03032 family)
MNQELKPFTCTHSPNLPEILFKLNCTLAISTYQAGKVILISAKDPNKLVQLPRSFKKPMGIAASGDKLAIATQDEVVLLNNAARMAGNYPQQPNTYDALYLPRATYITGELDIHDLHWQDDTIWAVNTRFSCLATLDHHYSFTPQWHPYFIKKITPDDQCHLNGVAFENNSPKYVTAIGSSDTGGSWRAQKAKGGILMDVPNNTIIATGLEMPHSPRIYNGSVYVLESASGNISRIDVANGNKEIVASLNGFVRGMDKIGDFIFIGMSHLRKSSTAFNDLPIASKSIFSGVAVFHLPTAKIVAYLKYENSVQEIYDVRILPGMKRPNLLNHLKPEFRLAVTTPKAEYWAMLKDKEKESNDETGSDRHT